jgi:hypothetical protein
MKTNVHAVGVMGTGAVQVGRRLFGMGDELECTTGAHNQVARLAAGTRVDNKAGCPSPRAYCHSLTG